MLIDVVRWLGFCAGLVLIYLTWHSIIVALILPRAITSRLAFWIWRPLPVLFRWLVAHTADYARKDRILALLGPASVLIFLIDWMLLLVLGFALLFWPWVDGGLGRALHIAGSSFFTLGVAAEQHPVPVLLEFLAAASGMITALRVRTGVPIWGPTILAQHQLDQALATLPSLFAAWETWAADIAESHVSYPWLLVFRSPDPLQSWLGGLLGIADAANLYIALAPRLAPPEARQCLRAACVVLNALVRLTNFAPPQALPTPRLSYAQFLAGVEQLRASGFPIEQPPEAAWVQFQRWRVQYEAAALGISQSILEQPSPWLRFGDQQTLPRYLQSDSE